MYNNYNLSTKKIMNFNMWVGLLIVEKSYKLDSRIVLIYKSTELCIYTHTRDHIYLITYIKV